RPPITAHPTATISDSTIFQGTHAISIGAGTIIHPRTRILSHDGPIIIGNGCVISEKSVIGAPLPVPSHPSNPLNKPLPSTSGNSGGSGSGGVGSSSPIPTRLSNTVLIGPGAQIHPGSVLHSAVTIDALAVVGRRAVVGAHSKVCAGCEVVPGGNVREWMVVWGVGGGFGQRRRARGVGKVVGVAAGGAGGGGGGGLEGRVIEDARLIVLHKEREALGRLIGVAAAGGRRR
ncbi:hypothetical protein BO71DRAFT_324844, partial [Aspergillus ellipticus CBS 707.79]